MIGLVTEARKKLLSGRAAWTRSERFAPDQTVGVANRQRRRGQRSFANALAQKFKHGVKSGWVAAQERRARDDGSVDLILGNRGHRVTITRA